MNRIFEAEKAKFEIARRKWAIVWTRVDGKENAEKLISFSCCTRLAVFLLLFVELLELDSVKNIFFSVREYIEECTIRKFELSKSIKNASMNVRD